MITFLRLHSPAGMRSGRACSLRFLFLVSLLPVILITGCSSVRQQTAVSGEINELQKWDDHEVAWVETIGGERVEFVDDGGRIEGERNRETRRIDYTVVGIDVAGKDRRLPLTDLTLVNTRVEEDDGWRSVGVIIVSVAAIVGAVVLVAVNP